MFERNYISIWPELLLIALFIIGLSFSYPAHAAQIETVKIYAAAGDGDVGTAPYPGAWSVQHGNSTGRIASYTNDEIRVKSGAFYTPEGLLTIDRGFLVFDLSEVPAGATIDEARLVVTPTLLKDDYDDERAYISLLQGFQTSTTTVNNSDILNCGDSFEDPTKGAADYDISNAELGVPVTYSLNQSGLGWLVPGGVSKLCFREGHDIENIETVKNVDDSTWQWSGIYFASSENESSESHPYLEITYTVDDTNDRPDLYTQIESPYPSVVETAEWADDIYSGGRGVNGRYPCGTTIAQCGCVITSLVMAARDSGITTDVLGDDVNPGNINAYIESVGGYTNTGALKWLAASAYLGEFQSDGTLASRFAAAPTRPGEFENTNDFVDNALSNDAAVLGHKAGHFLWVPSKQDDGTYNVNDPWWYNTITSDDTVASTSTFTRDYDNTFTDARAIAISESLIPFSGTDVEVHITSETAELLFESIAGDQVGYVDGQVVIDLERAMYGNTEVISLEGVPADADNGKHLLVYEAGEEFTIDVIGTDVGEFELEFFTIDEFGETATFSASGQTLPGIVTTFTFDLDTGEVIESELSDDDIRTLLDIVLEDTTTQQRKFFERWIDKVLDSGGSKTNSQVLQQIEVLEKLFKAKKVKHPLAPTLVDLLLDQATNQ